MTPWNRPPWCPPSATPRRDVFDRVRSKVTYSIFVLDIYILSFRYIWFCLYRLKKNKPVIYIDLDQQSLLTLWGCQSLENKFSRWPCLETSFSQVFSGIRSISDSKLWEKNRLIWKTQLTNGRKLILIPQKNSGVPGLKEHLEGKIHVMTFFRTLSLESRPVPFVLQESNDSCDISKRPSLKVKLNTRTWAENGWDAGRKWNKSSSFTGHKQKYPMLSWWVFLGTSFCWYLVRLISFCRNKINFFAVAWRDRLWRLGTNRRGTWGSLPERAVNLSRLIFFEGGNGWFDHNFSESETDSEDGWIFEFTFIFRDLGNWDQTVSGS